MPIKYVTIYSFPKGWNNVYPNSTTDVDSVFCAFTWRPGELAVELPLTRTFIVKVNLDLDESPRDTIANAIIKHFPERRDDEAAYAVADELLEKITLTEEAATLLDDTSPGSAASPSDND